MIATSGDWYPAGPQTNREGPKARAKSAGPRQAGGRSEDRGLSDPSVGALLQSCAISPQSPEVPTSLRLMLGPDPRGVQPGPQDYKTAHLHLSGHSNPGVGW